MPSYENIMVLDLPNAPWNRPEEPEAVSDEYQCPKCGEDRDQKLWYIRGDVFCATCCHKDQEDRFQIE